MSITSYSELQTTIADWLHRTNLTAVIPDFITLAESRINRLLYLGTLETNSTLTATVGQSTISLPADFITPIGLWITTYDPIIPVKYVNPDSIPLDVTNSGEPIYWTIDGSLIRFDILADQAYTFTLRYQALARLSDANPTNSILTNYPDIYLYGALLASVQYTKDDARIPGWTFEFNKAVKEVTTIETRKKKLATLSTEFNAMGNKTNILRG